MITKLTLFAMVLMMGPSLVWAAPYSPILSADLYDTTPDAVSTPKDQTDPGGKQIKDAINLLLGTSYARNRDVDHLQYTGNDSIWVDNSTPANDVGFVLLGVNASNGHKLRVFDTDTPNTMVGLFGQSGGQGFIGNGTSGNPFKAAVSPFNPGDTFGFSYLASTGHNWNSDPTKNAHGLDHMLTYDLPGLENKSVYIKIGNGSSQLYTFTNPYLIAWEDLPYNNLRLGDDDYNDALYVVDRVTPVPEPMSLALLGSGLAGAFAFRRKRA